MEKVLNFARLVSDVSYREIKGVSMKSKVIEFLDSLGFPAEKELNLFDDIIRKQDYSILDKNIKNAPWREGIELCEPSDEYTLKMLTYNILVKKFYGDDDSEMDHLLRDIYDKEDKGIGSEFYRMDTIVRRWIKGIVNYVFPFTKSVFTYDSDYDLSPEEIQKANTFMSLTRLAYVDINNMDDIDHMLIKILAKPHGPLYRNYNWDRIREFVEIAKEGAYTQLVKAYGSTSPHENILLYFINIYTLYDLSKEEKENLKSFTNTMQSMFGNIDNKSFGAFANKMLN